MMIEQFLSHIDRHRLFSSGDRILLAVSGGVDSMVMVNLFHSAHIPIGVAHCNFQLRGEESNEDETLVFEKCRNQQIPFFHIRFNTTAFAEERGISIQMAARELRYEWFEKLLVQQNFAAVATAHHQNDNLETVLLNITRGTGIDGLSGIPVKNGRIIRPLLFASREQILNYAKENDIQWREDKSNNDEHYQRNFIRKKIVPLLKEINPNLDDTIANTIERVDGARQLMNNYVSTFREQWLNQNNQSLRIDVKKIPVSHEGYVLLWELIKGLGFNYDQCRNILKDHQSGKRFISPSHELFIDRDLLVVEKRKTTESHDAVIIEKARDSVEEFGKKIRFEITEHISEAIPAGSNIASFDYEKIRFPIIWRPWKEGDRFVPLGMNQHKKVSDFLIDNKVSMADKPGVTVIESEGEIIWVVGFRISDSPKVTLNTRKVLKMVVE